MTLADYQHGQTIYHDALLGSPEGDPFYALIMAAFRAADTKNQALLRHCWPDHIRELCIRYEAPGGLLPAELRQAEAAARVRDRLQRDHRGPTQADRQAGIEACDAELADHERGEHL